MRIGERVVNCLSPKSRDIAMVFQSYALYPHLSVADNIGFALKIKKVPKEEIRRRVLETARMLDLEPYLKRKPRALSGGQRQRVAMGRAIIRQPQAFLMDEPLSNLDAKLRVEMRAYIARLHQELGTTTLYVTHDQTEAMTMGDRVAVMRDGRLEQCDTPQQLYEHPVNVFVAGFIGSPAMNLLRGVADEDGVLLGSSRLPLRSAHRGDVIVGIRPEYLEDAALMPDAPADRRLRGEVSLREALGSEIMVHFDVDATPATTEHVRELAEDTDAVTVREVEKETSRTTMIGRFGARSRVQEGEVAEVAVDTRSLHFFDPETGLGIYDQAIARKGDSA